MARLWRAKRSYDFKRAVKRWGLTKARYHAAIATKKQKGTYKWYDNYKPKRPLKMGFVKRTYVYSSRLD